MTEDLGATFFFCTPERVTLEEFERRKRDDAVDERERQRRDAAERRSGPRVQPLGCPLPSSPTPLSALVPAPILAPPRLPDCPSPDCPCRKQLFEQRQRAGYWKSLHER